MPGFQQQFVIRRPLKLTDKWSCLSQGRIKIGRTKTTPALRNSLHIPFITQLSRNFLVRQGGPPSTSKRPWQRKRRWDLSVLGDGMMEMRWWQYDSAAPMFHLTSIDVNPYFHQIDLEWCSNISYLSIFDMYFHQMIIWGFICFNV